MKNRIRTPLVAAAAAAMVALGASAASAYTLDDNGTGFVGKGEVQTAFGWNNAALQRNADSVSFEYAAITATESSWVCVNERNGNEQERSRTTTTTTTGVVDETTRDRNQVTGFMLLGSTAGSSTSETSGNPLYSCPNANSTFALDSVEESTETVSGGLYAVYGTQRVLLP
jgi:hypothetical protein